MSGRLPPRADRVVGQAPGLSGFLTARENVELGLALREVDGVEARERAKDALAVVGLAEHADGRSTVSPPGSASVSRSHVRSPRGRP